MDKPEKPPFSRSKKVGYWSRSRDDDTVVMLRNAALFPFSLFFL